MLCTSLPRWIRSGERLLVLDGASGTELRRRGAGAECLERANSSQPELVSTLAREYADAGAALVRTNTFQANALALRAHGLEREVDSLNRAAVQLARLGAGEDAQVVGSIGPLGMRFRTPSIEREQARAVYAEQALALEAGGADALVLETLIDLDEAELALDVLAHQVSIPFGLTMTFRADPSGPRTATGATPEAVVRVAESAGAAFVGANCGTGLEGMEELARALSRSRLPLWMAPSAGVPGAARSAPMATPAAFAELGTRLGSLGVAVYGGCCGTDPTFIRALSARLALKLE